jgi:putative ABC transport system ATP-binding protein/lipoprotein-releasing system ATP-binding protein
MSSLSLSVAATNIHRTYFINQHQLHVLNGINLKVFKGEKVFLCGHSGSGKTTLLYILGGLEKPDQGDILLHDASFYKLSNRKQAKIRNQHLGFVFQHYHLLPELSALENVLFPALLAGRQDLDRAKFLLDRVGLSHRLNHLPTELSGGEQQRVAIARSLINNPSILFADEPTGNLDPSTGGAVMEMLLNLVQEEQKTLIVVTHDMNLAKSGDRTLFIKEGVLAD